MEYWPASVCPDLFEIVMTAIYRYEAATIAERDNIKRIENLIKWKTSQWINLIEIADNTIAYLINNFHL